MIILLFNRLPARTFFHWMSDEQEIKLMWPIKVFNYLLKSTDCDVMVSDLLFPSGTARSRSGTTSIRRRRRSTPRRARNRMIRTTPPRGESVKKGQNAHRHWKDRRGAQIGRGFSIEYMEFLRNMFGTLLKQEN